MDFFARLIDSWVCFVYFSFISKETRQNPATAPVNIKIIHSFLVLRGFVRREDGKNPTIDWEMQFTWNKNQTKISSYW